MAKLFFLVTVLACSAIYIVTANNCDDDDDDDVEISSSSSSSSKESSGSSSASSSSSSTYTSSSGDNSPLCCPVNEEYVKCPATLCRAQNCSQLGFPVPCPYVGPDGPCPVKPGCVCVNGYLRNKNGVCIPAKQCPSCGGDPNAQAGCGVFCNRCQGPIPCPKICRSNSCDCKPNFVYDQNIKKCVKKSQCTPVCSQNEVYSDCINGGCWSARNCTEIGQPLKCVKLKPSACIKGCLCKDKYLRAPSGICVPEENCQKLLCPEPNQVYDNCVSNCPPSCGDLLGRQRNCPLQPAVCKSGCKCEDNYYRNSIGQCVTKEQCLQCPGPHEYYACGGACDNVCATLSEQNQTNCPIINVKCNEMCYCEENYARDDNNDCIPIEDCNKEPKCPPGEVYSKCPPTKCDAEYCPKSRNDMQSCPYGVVGCAKARCVCGFNSHRSRETGKCIPTAKCPPFPCEGPNEEYIACPPVCPGEKCLDYLNNSKCPKYKIGIVVPCKPQCRCKKGHYRNSENICVKSCECAAEGNGTSPSNVNATAALAQLEQGDVIYTGKFLNELVKSKPGVSLISSPVSCFVPFAELALWAKGKSYDELTSALNLRSKVEIRAAFPLLLKSYAAQENVEFKLAQKVWSNEQFALSDAFKADTKNVFNAEAENVNFSKNVDAADTINAWVEAQTNNRIKNLVSPNMLSADTRLVLTNAIYFKGNWVHQFNPNNTKDKDFHVSSSKTVKVKTMYQSGSFRYAESDTLDAQILELPYKNKNFSFVAFLPRSIDGLSALVPKLESGSAFRGAINALSTEKVNIYLPSMEINTSLDLKELLIKTNIKQIFNVTDSGLDGILKQYEPLYVSAAIQKAFIIVNEVGSEAAAANVIGAAASGAPATQPKIYIFNADHPFLFYILFRSNPIFCAIVITKQSLPLPPPKIYLFKADHPFVFYITFKGNPLFCGTYTST